MRIAIFNNFANYENRVERRLENYEDYIVAAGAGNSFGPFDKINFKYRDGIITSQVVNLPKGTPNFNPNYFLVLADDTDEILSRWYVIESYNTRGLQYSLSLVRDIIADHWNEVMDATSVVSRGWTNVGSNASSPIMNSEGFSCSQVKQTEHLLKDKTGSAWVVGYIKNYDTDPAPTVADEINFYSSPENTRSEPESVTAMFEGTASTGYAYDRQMADAYAITYCYAPVGAEEDGYHPCQVGTTTAKLKYPAERLGVSSYGCSWNAVQGFPGSKSISTMLFEQKSRNLIPKTSFAADLKESFDAKELTAGRPWNDEVDQYIGQKFYDPSNRPYVLGRVEIPSKVLVKTAAADVDWWENDVGSIIRACALNAAFPAAVFHVKEPFGAFEKDYVEIEVMTYTYVRQYVGLSEDKVTLALNHASLSDRPWSMCAMPVDSINIKNRSTQTTPGVAKAFASALSEQLGEKCIDVQLLPYCPCPEFLDGNAISLTGLSEHVDYEWVKSGDSIVTILLWARKCSAKISIPFTRYSLPDDPLEFKVEQETKLYRLTAPNYSSAWEFSICKNRGLYAFDVDFTYEPYNSYLRVAPHFGGLYGANFGDSRGLVISCDTSLPKISDNWVNYQLQNANYQKVFDRQIKTQEIGIAVSAASTVLDIGLSAVQGGIGISKPLSAIKKETSRIDDRYAEVAATLCYGDNEAWDRLNLQYSKRLNDLEMRKTNALTSGVMSLSSTGIEAINDAGNMFMQIRAVEDAKFNHEMNIANIKAQPQTITQIGAFNINNKLFPVLEIYDATESEKNNIREFIKYRSMNIGRTATIREYLSDNERTWIEAALIDTFDFVGDAHELASLKSELQKGVYIYNE